MAWANLPKYHESRRGPHGGPHPRNYKGVEMSKLSTIGGPTPNASTGRPGRPGRPGVAPVAPAPPEPPKPVPMVKGPGLKPDLPQIKPPKPATGASKK
jgi:hypothetical protein